MSNQQLTSGLDPTNDGLRQSIPLLKGGYKFYTIVKSCHPISCWIRYKHGWIIVTLSSVLLPVVLRRVRHRDLAAEAQRMTVAPATSV